MTVYPLNLHVRTHTFPPRRSSDLVAGTGKHHFFAIRSVHAQADEQIHVGCRRGDPQMRLQRTGEFCLLLERGCLEADGIVESPVIRPRRYRRRLRSEEHTSELQSLMRNSYAVFCLKKTHTP